MTTNRGIEDQHYQRLLTATDEQLIAVRDANRKDGARQYAAGWTGKAKYYYAYADTCDAILAARHAAPARAANSVPALATAAQVQTLTSLLAQAMRWSDSVADQYATDGVVDTTKLAALTKGAASALISELREQH